MAVVMWNPGPGAFWKTNAAPAPAPVGRRRPRGAEMMAAYDGRALSDSRFEAEAWAAAGARRRAVKNRRRALRTAARVVASSVRSVSHIRLSRRRRLQVEAAAVGLAFLGAFAAAGVAATAGVKAVIAHASAGTSSSASSVQNFAAVTLPMTVAPGDSLWTLARRYGDPDSYILDRVDDLARANGMTAGARLVPGQRLLVPVGNPVEIARIQQSVASAR